MTALMVATRDGRASCVRLLVKKGARVNLSRNRVRYNVGIVCESDWLLMFIMIVCNVSILESRNYCASYCCPWWPGGMLFDSARKRSRARDTKCAFILLSNSVISLLVALRMPIIDFCFEQPNSTTALMEAARAGNLGCVKVLVKAGASLTVKDVRIWLCNVSFLRPELMGSNIGGVQRDGNTAEHIAMMAGHTGIEDYLREQAESVSTALA